jgi:hypothetical protein
MHACMHACMSRGRVGCGGGQARDFWIRLVCRMPWCSKSWAGEQTTASQTPARRTQSCVSISVMNCHPCTFCAAHHAKLEHGVHMVCAVRGVGHDDVERWTLVFRKYLIEVLVAIVDRRKASFPEVLLHRPVAKIRIVDPYLAGFFFQELGLRKGECSRGNPGGGRGEIYSSALRSQAAGSYWRDTRRGHGKRAAPANAR